VSREGTPSVDVFVTSCKEPSAIVMKTLEAALAIRYPEKRVHLLDVGGSPELERFCRAREIRYLARGDLRDEGRLIGAPQAQPEPAGASPLPLSLSA